MCNIYFLQLFCDSTPLSHTHPVLLSLFRATHRWMSTFKVDLLLSCYQGAGGDSLQAQRFCWNQRSRDLVTGVTWNSNTCSSVSRFYTYFSSFISAKHRDREMQMYRWRSKVSPCPHFFCRKHNSSNETCTSWQIIHQLHCKSQMTLQHDSDCTPLLNPSPISAPPPSFSDRATFRATDDFDLNLKTRMRCHLQSPSANAMAPQSPGAPIPKSALYSARLRLLMQPLHIIHHFSLAGGLTVN